MNMRNLERAVWQEAKRVFCNPNLRLKDLLEWSTSKSAVMSRMERGDVIAGVPCGAWVCILAKHDKRPERAVTDGL